MTTQLNVRWLCPHRTDPNPCNTSTMTILPVTEPPTHVCRNNGNKITALVMDPSTPESQKILAIRQKPRYGNSQPTEKTSGHRAMETDMARSAPGAPVTEKTTDTAKTTKTPAKKASAPKAPAAKKEKATKPAAAPKAPKAEVPAGEVKHRLKRGERGHLQDQIEDIFRTHEAGKLKIDGAVYTGPLTVHKTRALVPVNPLDGGLPSTGAVSAVFDRWEKGGYIKLTKERPVAFTGFQAKWSAAKTGSLDKYLQSIKDAKAKAKTAA